MHANGLFWKKCMKYRYVCICIYLCVCMCVYMYMWVYTRLEYHWKYISFNQIAYETFIKQKCYNFRKMLIQGRTTTMVTQREVQKLTWRERGKLHSVHVIHSSIYSFFFIFCLLHRLTNEKTLLFKYFKKLDRKCKGKTSGTNTGNRVTDSSKWLHSWTQSLVYELLLHLSRVGFRSLSSVFTRPSPVRLFFDNVETLESLHEWYKSWIIFALNNEKKVIRM